MHACALRRNEKLLTAHKKGGMRLQACNMQHGSREPPHTTHSLLRLLPATSSAVALLLCALSLFLFSLVPLRCALPFAVRAPRAALVAQHVGSLGLCAALQ